MVIMDSEAQSLRQPIAESAPREGVPGTEGLKIDSGVGVLGGGSKPPPHPTPPAGESGGAL